jgi:precorrin-3B methylase
LPNADFALALYNPVSSQRRWQLDETRTIVLRHRAPQTPVVLARDIGGPTEALRIVELGDLRTDDVDMRTVVLVGASTTRTFAAPNGRRYVYTPRTYGDVDPHAGTQAAADSYAIAVDRA